MKKNINTYLFFCILAVTEVAWLLIMIFNQDIPFEANIPSFETDSYSFNEIFVGLLGVPILISMLIFSIVCRPILIKIEQREKGIINQHMFCIYEGLTLPEKTSCEVIEYKDRYEFISSGITFNLQKNRVADISIITDKEIKKYQQYVSSVGGTVGGAFIGGFFFGPLGATLGAMSAGRAKRESWVDSKETKYLTFTYIKNEEGKYLRFILNNYTDISAAWKYVEKFKENKTINNIENTKIEL